MTIAPPSTHFRPVSLTGVSNADRTQLTGPLRPPSADGRAFGWQVFHGIPFELGAPDRPNVIVLIAAHTSAVQVVVDGATPFSQPDAMAVLEQIEGTMAYVDTLATRPEARRYRQLRATLESAYNRLHQEMHRNGVFHRHVPLHDHAEHREH